jgi:hypothetical protein
MQQLYFYEPFAFTGDKTSIPFPTDSTGLVSFNQGYGPDYALDLNSNPSAIALDRTKDNFLWYSVTNNLQNYQQYGIPEWITTADNQGAAFPYDIGATVRYRAGSSGPFQSYVSLITSNTNTPSNDGVHWSIPLNEFIADARYMPINESLMFKTTNALITGTYTLSTLTSSSNNVILGTGTFNLPNAGTNGLAIYGLLSNAGFTVSIPSPGTFQGGPMHNTSSFFLKTGSFITVQSDGQNYRVISYISGP